MFEGSGCVAHRGSSALGCALKVNSEVMSLVRKIKGIIAHFHKSNKVSFYIPCDCYPGFSLVLLIAEMESTHGHH